jgi:hypothetical protein
MTRSDLSSKTLGQSACTRQDTECVTSISKILPAVATKQGLKKMGSCNVDSKHSPRHCQFEFEPAPFLNSSTNAEKFGFFKACGIIYL